MPIMISVGRLKLITMLIFTTVIITANVVTGDGTCHAILRLESIMPCYYKAFDLLSSVSLFLIQHCCCCHHDHDYSCWYLWGKPHTSHSIMCPITPHKEVSTCVSLSQLSVCLQLCTLFAACTLSDYLV